MTARLRIRELARKVASGAQTAADEVERRLARISQSDGELHSFIEVFAESARADAEGVDRAREQGRSLGPLAGVPVAHKDIFFRPGRAPTCGVARDHILP